MPYFKATVFYSFKEISYQKRNKKSTTLLVVGEPVKNCEESEVFFPTCCLTIQPAGFMDTGSYMRFLGQRQRTLLFRGIIATV